jgi:hypothetical protein
MVSFVVMERNTVTKREDRSGYHPDPILPERHETSRQEIPCRQLLSEQNCINRKIPLWRLFRKERHKSSGIND